METQSSQARAGLSPDDGAPEHSGAAHGPGGLAARIDRLPSEENACLQAAAVVGKDVPFPLLQEIAELPEDALRHGLTHLQAAEFLYEISLFPDLEYPATRPHPPGCLWEPPAGAAARSPCADRRGHRAALPRPADQQVDRLATMPFEASCGTRPSPTWIRPATRRQRARPTGRRGLV